jgi:Flp pilus assembly protein TadG
MLRLLRQERANVAIEFAVCAVFLLLPLLAGSADIIVVLSAQAQLNTALQAIDYFAYTNPTSATNATEAGYIVSLINNASNFRVVLPATMTSGLANGATSYGCFSPPANTATVITYQTTACAGGQTQLTYVTYQVTATVSLPFPVPLNNPYSLSATTKVQTH